MSDGDFSGRRWLILAVFALNSGGNSFSKFGELCEPLLSTCLVNTQLK